MASIEYLPAHKLKRLVKDLRVCADALHKQLDETKRQCALIEEVMREIRRQTTPKSMLDAPLVSLSKAGSGRRPELKVVEQDPKMASFAADQSDSHPSSKHPSSKH
jgi:hypothetical protein